MTDNTTAGTAARNRARFKAAKKATDVEPSILVRRAEELTTARRAYIQKAEQAMQERLKAIGTC